jgi:hypothetical protein
MNGGCRSKEHYQNGNFSCLLLDSIINAAIVICDCIMGLSVPIGHAQLIQELTSNR